MNEKVSEEECNNEDVAHVQSNNSHSLFLGNGQNETFASEQFASDEKTQKRTTEEKKMEDEMKPAISTFDRDESTTPKPIPVPIRSVREKTLPQRYDRYIIYRLTETWTTDYMLLMCLQSQVFCVIWMEIPLTD